MFTVFSSAARWEVDGAYRMFMEAFFILTIIFCILAIISFISFILYCFKVKLLVRKKALFLKTSIIASCVLSIVLYLVLFINDSHIAEGILVIPILSIVSSLGIIIFNKFLFNNKWLLLIILLTLIITTSVFCLPKAIGSHDELHKTYQPCNDYIIKNGKEFPDCPV